MAPSNDWREAAADQTWQCQMSEQVMQEETTLSHQIRGLQVTDLEKVYISQQKLSVRCTPFYTWFLWRLGYHLWTQAHKILEGTTLWQNMGFFSFSPPFVWAGNPQRKCKKQNLRFKSTTTLEGICTILESVKNEQAVLLKADFRKPHSCPVVHLFVAVALIGHLELASRAENSKTCKTCLWNMKHVSMKHVCYAIYPLKDEEQCHIQQALLCSQPSEKCL